MWEIFHFHEIYWGGYSLIIEGDVSPIPPGFALMLIEFPKNIGKSRDKSYPTDQKTSSILVPTTENKAAISGEGLQQHGVQSRVLTL